MTIETTRTTGNEPVEGLDPGGTRPAPRPPKKPVSEPVESGDRNTRATSEVKST